VSAIAAWITMGSFVGGGYGSQWAWGLFIWGGAAAAGTGLTDDLVKLRPSVKFAGELLAVTPAVVVLAQTLPPGPPWLSVAVWIFLTAGYVNLFNFMDGSDGLAAGVAVINAMALAVLAAPAPLATSSLVLGAAALGFLWFNRPPASVFMGDAGSLFLGYGFAMTGTMLVAAGISGVAVGLAVAPFAFDGAFTLLSRLARGERVWEAHRSHLYQRLLIAGWTHREVARLYWSWAAIAGAASIGYELVPGWPRGIALSTSAGAAAGVLLLVRSVERRATQRTMAALHQ
jgi:UDP-N-acetylmuramyl pentapeptide phosphotransferase/UDP-N-acetylglucosamine-1-phosphate transferase